MHCVVSKKGARPCLQHASQLNDERLFPAALAQLCADNELCNSFMTFNTNYHDTGLWGVYAVADKDCAMDELAWAIMQARVCSCAC